MTELLTTSLSRRGLVATAGATAALTTAGAPASARGAGLRVGVLTPSATSFPGSAASLLDGLATGFAGGIGDPVRVRLESRPVPYGYAGAGAAAEQLIARGARVVVAGVSALVVPRLAGVCADRGVALVVANVGAHVVTEATPGVLHSSLQHWQSSLSMGQWAAGRLGRRIFQIVSVPDAGYDTVYAVRRGFQQGGGQFVGHALTHEDPSADGVLHAARAARRSGATVVAVSASGARAAEIVRACRRAGVRADLVVDSLALEPFAVPAMGRSALGVHSAASWTRSADGAANRDFVRAYRVRTGRQPDAFSVLGHDTALLVAAGARRVRRSGRPWSRLPEALAGVTVPGARGSQVVDRTLRTVSTPLAVRTTRRRSGTVLNEVVARRHRVAGVPASLAALEAREVAAYVNEYLGT